jgi:hypothetical protein
MVQSIVITFAFLWPISVGLYWIAMKLLRARTIHCLWLATVETYPTSIMMTEGAEEYLRQLDVQNFIICDL